MAATYHVFTRTGHRYSLIEVELEGTLISSVIMQLIKHMQVQNQFLQQQFHLSSSNSKTLAPVIAESAVHHVHPVQPAKQVQALKGIR